MSLKRVLYSETIKKINKVILSAFYDKKYLSGKFFDEQRYGFIWAWKGIPYSFKHRKNGVKWPVSKFTRMPSGFNMEVDPSSLNIFQQPGCYFQNYNATIKIGKDVWIAQNVGIITENHDPMNPDKHLAAKSVTIEDHCWIGMNAMILPGVTLGEYTTVGAGSVVTKSFPGHCIIAGNPAKILKIWN